MSDPKKNVHPNKRLPKRDKWIILGIVILAVVVGAFALPKGQPKIFPVVETSQGVIIRSQIKYSRNNDANVITALFEAPDWLETANTDTLAIELCDFVLTSNWGAMGVTPQNADHIMLIIIGRFRPLNTQLPMVCDCKVNKIEWQSGSYPKRE